VGTTGWCFSSILPIAWRHATISAWFTTSLMHSHMITSYRFGGAYRFTWFGALSEHNWTVPYWSSLRLFWPHLIWTFGWTYGWIYGYMDQMYGWICGISFKRLIHIDTLSLKRLWALRSQSRQASMVRFLKLSDSRSFRRLLSFNLSAPKLHVSYC
jgi:hypothetical protein